MMALLLFYMIQGFGLKMKIDVIPLGIIGANCYLVSDDDFALVIDPGKYDERIAKFLNDNAGVKRYIILTHAHFDHICGAKQLREETNTDILISKNDAEGLFNPKFSLSEYFHIRQPIFYADKMLDDGEILSIGSKKIECLLTPGHSPGSMCFLIDEILFSGDTLFAGSIGRTDFPNSNHNDMISSLKRLSQLKAETRVLPGHGEGTTIGVELVSNPFLRNLL